MPAVSRFQAIIFDVDGTLYDQKCLRRKIARRMLVAYGLHPIRGLRAIRSINAYRLAHENLRDRDISFDTQLLAAAGQCGYSPAEIHGVIEHWMEREPLDLLSGCIYPGVVNLLEELTAAGIPRGVFSDYPAQAKLHAMGLSSFFSHVSCAQEVGRLKPDPRGILELLKAMSVPPGRAIYIGDRNIDKEAASRAGTQVELIGNGTTYLELRHRLLGMPDLIA